MFRPSPEASLFRRIPYRLIVAVLLIQAAVVAAILLFTLDQAPLIVEARRDLIVMACLIYVVSAIGTAAVITSLHYDSTIRTLEVVKGLARNILESIPTGVLTLNGRGIITAVNPSAEALLKCASLELLGHSYESVFTESDTIRGALNGALRSHRHMSQIDLPYQTRDGSPHTIRVSTAELTGDDGQPAGVILQAQDVTEWLALERKVMVAEKLTALHMLSAGVAHELRNPLSAIDLNLHLLEQEFKEHAGPTKQAAHYLLVLNAECHRLSVILDNFMKFARPGAMSLHAVDLPALIHHIVALMQHEAEERKITLEQCVDKNLPPVLGDETQISQVLVNIVVNAFHAMPNGGRCRIAAQTYTGERKRWVEIEVTDTGIGIEKEDLPRLFVPFYTTKSSGTGVGLAIAYRIMQDHGGSIQVSSLPGNGTTVTMRFPAAVDHQQSVAVGL